MPNEAAFQRIYVFEPVAVTSSWLDAILNAEGYPDQLLPMAPLARLKLSRTTVIGNPLEAVEVTVGEAVRVAVSVKVAVGVGVKVWIAVNVDVAVRVAVLVGSGVLLAVEVRAALGVFVGVRGGVAVFVATEGSTVRVAAADEVFVTPFPVLNAPDGIVFVKLPGVLEVTLIATVQEPGVDPT